MRLLHTSDWHLGRSFHREDLLGAQAAFVDFLLETVRSERVDAVVVSGDIYDRALPGVDAVGVCNDALRRLAAAHVPTVLISGNHDSARRLGFGADLIAAAGVHLRTDPLRCGRPVLLADRHGPVAIYGLPYLEPDAVRGALGCDERGHEAVLRTAMGSVRADLAERAAGTRSIVLAHAIVAGGQPSDSERDISVGGVSAVPAATFDGIDYVALGHLHGAQAVSAEVPGVHYSGSPLAYSFSEHRHHKSVTLVELERDGLTCVERIPCPVPRPLSLVRGRLEDLLTGGAHTEFEGHYLQVTLTDAQRPAEPMQRLRQRFPHTLVLAFEPEGRAERDERTYADRVRGRSDLDVGAGFVEHVRGQAPTEAEVALLRDAFEAHRLAGTETVRV
jgi:exonuclease SbcD